MLLTKFQPYLELGLLIHSTCVCFAMHAKLKKSHYLKKQSQLDFRNSLLDHLYFFPGGTGDRTQRLTFKGE